MYIFYYLLKVKTIYKLIFLFEKGIFIPQSKKTIKAFIGCPILKNESVFITDSEPKLDLYIIKISTLFINNQTKAITKIKALFIYK